MALAIWTTTPWTIPANAAVAVNGELTYAVVAVASRVEGGRKLLVVAKDLVASLAAKLGCGLEAVGELTGAQLEVREGGGAYSDAKVANREIRVWHFVIENGY
jgi:isoleucyl-tRNA synthetase